MLEQLAALVLPRAQLVEGSLLGCLGIWDGHFVWALGGQGFLGSYWYGKAPLLKTKAMNLEGLRGAF